jgi:dTDP-4-dehydrorhamnose 3,5-epimerase-like enzyme
LCPCRGLRTLLSGVPKLGSEQPFRLASSSLESQFLMGCFFWCVRAEEPDSPTYRVINEIYRTEHHRTLMVIPAYVFHAHHNVGQTEALFISMPTRIYHHESPDVYRLPLDNNTIPYRFEQRLGW